METIVDFIEDWGTLVVAGAALLMSLASLKFGSRADKVQRFAAIQEQLIGAEAQRGRRLLYELEAVGKWNFADIENMKRFDSGN